MGHVSGDFQVQLGCMGRKFQRKRSGLHTGQEGILQGRGTGASFPQPLSCFPLEVEEGSCDQLERKEGEKGEVVGLISRRELLFLTSYCPSHLLTEVIVWGEK